MQFWVFQASSSKFDIEKCLSECAEIPWVVPEKHTQQIYKPDRVAVCTSGSDGGLWALCTVTDYPRRGRDISEFEAAYWSEPIEPGEHDLACMLQVDQVAESMVPADVINGNRRLQKLQLFRLSKPTYHQLTEAQWKSVEDLVAAAVSSSD